MSIGGTSELRRRGSPVAGARQIQGNRHAWRPVAGGPHVYARDKRAYHWQRKTRQGWGYAVVLPRKLCTGVQREGCGYHRGDTHVYRCPGCAAVEVGDHAGRGARGAGRGARDAERIVAPPRLRFPHRSTGCCPIGGGTPSFRRPVLESARRARRHGALPLIVQVGRTAPVAWTEHCPASASATVAIAKHTAAWPRQGSGSVARPARRQPVLR